MQWIRLVLALVLLGAGGAWPSAVRAADPVLLPFRGGLSVRVIQGYNGGTHQGASRYALDMLLASGGSSGAEVLSPIGGSVVFAQPSGGCIAIAMTDRTYSVMLCHVQLGRGFRPGERVERGEVIGTVGAPGTVRNNGTAHVHMELHRGASAGSPIPFGGPEGLPLEGVDLPASGTANEHGGRTDIVSSNAGGAAIPVPPAPAPAPTSAPRQAPPDPAPTAAPRQPQPTPAPVLQPAPAARSADQAAATSVRAPRAAVVQGTDSCLKVREQPSAEAAVVDCLPDGSEVALSATVELVEALRWREVPGQGWVADDFLRRTRGVVSGTDSCLNVRDGPSTLGRVLGCIPDGTSVGIAEGPVAGDLGDWLRVGSGGAESPAGWVLAGYLD